MDKEERMRRVMKYAQLDLSAAINYALGKHDSFEVKAATRTLKELAEFTEEAIGEDLYYLLDE